MRNLFSVAMAVCTIFAVAGCNPMGPMPIAERLSDDNQRTVNAGWENILQPVEGPDRQALLDMLIYAQAYQLGVDRLTFRSEKDFSGGMVIMEIHYDRSKPAADRFEVWVHDKAGKQLRHLTYSRAEVTATFKDLHNPRFVKQLDQNDPPLEHQEAIKHAEVQKRIAAVENLLPKAAAQADR